MTSPDYRRPGWCLIPLQRPLGLWWINLPRPGAAYFSCLDFLCPGIFSGCQGTGTPLAVGRSGVQEAGAFATWEQRPGCFPLGASSPRPRRTECMLCSILDRVLCGTMLTHPASFQHCFSPLTCIFGVLISVSLWGYSVG